MSLDLPLVWAGLLGFAVLAYILLDGFDLGVGILFPLVPGEANRDEMMNSVAPVWDGNETWLVLGGGGLFAVFPLAYAVIMPALYAPVIAMLLGLVLRGVAFEFRWKTQRGKFVWDWAFASGSMIAAFAQGIALGALVQGIPVAGRAYAGGWWDWLTPFSVVTGIALVVGYALLGATWLIYKTEGHVRERAYAFARITAIGTLGLIFVVSLWTPFLNASFMHRWFAWPQIAIVAPVPSPAVVVMRETDLKHFTPDWTVAVWGTAMVSVIALPSTSLPVMTTLAGASEGVTPAVVTVMGRG